MIRIRLCILGRSAESQSHHMIFVPANVRTLLCPLEIGYQLTNHLCYVHEGLDPWWWTGSSSHWARRKHHPSKYQFQALRMKISSKSCLFLSPTPDTCNVESRRNTYLETAFPSNRDPELTLHCLQTLPRVSHTTTSSSPHVWARHSLLFVI